jgi:hypothetical protein
LSLGLCPESELFAAKADALLNESDLDECPALHAGVGASRDPRALSVSGADFEFISENSQIASIREFMQLLPETLRR